ncbi:MAG: fatty acid desaturase, partial [Planctomycetaceae bacterium]|nr:fatty acid desaturase [Planctomycetaceae bacterium]
IVPVLALYVGPYLFVNFWLVLYTWLQHTDVDVPHFEDEEWSWVLGAFMTIDRPYGPVLDFLHHRIGSTHVAHHVDARIPHYNAKRATEALKTAFPELYLYDPTPIPKALWRIATNCNVVSKADVGWKFVVHENHNSDD